MVPETLEPQCVENDFSPFTEETIFSYVMRWTVSR
jgi:hypothetical protein